MESQFKSVINNKFKNNNEFLAKYDNFKESRTVPYNITWEKMKESYGWGYKKGSLIDPLITWIYLRPDVKNDLDRGEFKANHIPERLILNKHFFIVEQKAIGYLKLHCQKVIQEEELAEEAEEDEESSSSSEENKSLHSSDLSYQTLKRRRRNSTPLGIDDFAVESCRNKIN